MATAAQPRRRLTETTWASQNWQYSPGTRLGWEQLHDLACDLAELVPHLTADRWRTLLDISNAGLPVVMTWDLRLSADHYAQPVERTRVTVMVDRLVVPPPGPPAGSVGRVRVRYCGFGHDVYLDKVRDIEPTPATTVYLTEQEALTYERP